MAAPVSSSAPLSNGVTMPSVGFGCAFGNWTGDTERQGFLPEQAWHAVSQAFDVGYRHFDIAHAYGTERHVRDVLAPKFMAGTLKRDDFFVTTKIFHPAAPPHIAISGSLTWDARDVPDVGARTHLDYEKSLDNIGLGYFDLCLMHWPGVFKETDAAFARGVRKQVWGAQEQFLAKGSARAIGVANFSRRHLEELMEDCEVKPMVNQIEVHPYCYDKDLIDFCHANGIVVEAYAPFASGSFGLLKDPVITEIADRVGKSTGQVILRWHAQLGHVVLPKSSNPARMAANLDLYSFELTDADMAAITGLGASEMKRTCPDPATIV